MLTTLAITFLLAQQPRPVAEIIEPGATTVVSSVGFDAAGNLICRRRESLGASLDHGGPWQVVDCGCFAF